MKRAQGGEEKNYFKPVLIYFIGISTWNWSRKIYILNIFHLHHLFFPLGVSHFSNCFMLFCGIFSLLLLPSCARVPPHVLGLFVVHSSLVAERKSLSSHKWMTCDFHSLSSFPISIITSNWVHNNDDEDDEQKTHQASELNSKTLEKTEEARREAKCALETQQQRSRRRAHSNMSFE